MYQYIDVNGVGLFVFEFIERKVFWNDIKLIYNKFG